MEHYKCDSLCFAEVYFLCVTRFDCVRFFFFVGVVCSFVCMWEFCLFFFLNPICMYDCHNRDYFHFTYLITQQDDGSSVRDSMSSVRMLYDSLCLFVFLPDLSSATFFFLSPSLSIFCDYSKELHSTFFEQERVTTKL